MSKAVENTSVELSIRTSRPLRQRRKFGFDLPLKKMNLQNDLLEVRQALGVVVLKDLGVTLGHGGPKYHLRAVDGP